MQTTLHSPEAVLQAAAHVERGHARLLKLLGFVPDDKLAWSPSPTSRSSIRIVEHCALSNAFFMRIVTGTMPEPMPTPEAFFRDLHAGEGKVSTREEAIAMLEESTASLLKAIRALDDRTLDATPASPFGPLPMRFWLEQMGGHLDYHEGQLAFLQTVWGDRDDHMG